MIDWNSLKDLWIWCSRESGNPVLVVFFHLSSRPANALPSTPCFLCVCALAQPLAPRLCLCLTVLIVWQLWLACVLTVTSHVPVSCFLCSPCLSLPSTLSFICACLCPLVLPAPPCSSLSPFLSPPITINHRMTPITRTCWCVRVLLEWPPVSLPLWEASPGLYARLDSLTAGFSFIF